LIRVLISASSPLVKAGIASLLRDYQQLQLIEEEPDDSVPSSGGALADTEADVVIITADDADTTQDAPRRFTGDAPVILLTRGDAPDLRRVARDGVRAVLPLDASGAQIAAAIEAVVAGLAVFDSAAIAQLRDTHPSNDAPRHLAEPLTPREIEVLRAMAEGLGNKEIAARLGISENTVKFHVGSVLGKLGAESRTQAVMLGIRHGFVFI
jgi:two-component system, NarL family, response regulator YdfI